MVPGNGERMMDRSVAGNVLRNEALATPLPGLKSVDAAGTSEIERYVVWPAQALGYKLGQQKILALREGAQEAFGDAFDIRDFNQQLLDVASTPLPFIEATVISWILLTSGRRSRTGAFAFVFSATAAALLRTFGSIGVVFLQPQLEDCPEGTQRNHGE